MYRLLLTAAVLALTPVALAGGSGPRPAPAPTKAAPAKVVPVSKTPTLPANALVKPGQTWVLSGTTATGEKISREFVLSKDAPAWDDGWDFEAENGPLSYDPEGKTMFAADMSGLETGEDVQVCLALIEGQGARGSLFTGDINGIREQMAQVPDSAPDVKTPEEMAQTLKKAGLKVGTCTLKRK